MLNNYVCFFLWLYAACTFFIERVDVEEIYLVRFFGEKYVEYASKTPIGIPFVKGNKDLNQRIAEYRKKKRN